MRLLTNLFVHKPFVPEKDVMEAILRIRTITSLGVWTWMSIYYVTFILAIAIPSAAVGTAFVGIILGALDQTSIITILVIAHLAESVDVSVIFWLNPRAVAARYDKAFTYFIWMARIWQIIDPDNPETATQIRYYMQYAVGLTQSTEAIAIFDHLYGSERPAIPEMRAIVDTAGKQHLPPE